MPALSLYFLATKAPGGNFLALQNGGTAPGSVTTGTGWTVAKTAASNYDLMFSTVKRAAATFGATALPTSGLDTTNGDGFRTEQRLWGSFASANWTLAFKLQANTASNQAGQIRVRIYRSANADGSSATEITSGATAGTTATWVTTSNEQTSTVTVNPGVFSLSGEFLFVQVAWAITTASGSNSGDVLIRTNSTALITTSTFTDSLGTTLYRELVEDTAGLRSYWRLGETSGTTRVDSAGGVNLGINGSPTLGVTGALGAADTDPAGRYDGSNDFDRLASGASQYNFTGTAPFSVEFFIKPRVTPGGFPKLVSKATFTTVDLGWYVALANNNKPYIQRFDAAGANDLKQMANALTNGAWTHLCFTYSVTNGLILYVNGTADGSPVASTRSISSEATNTGLITLGAYSDGTSNFDGDLDEVAIYDVELSSATVAAHYAAAAQPTAANRDAGVRFNLQIGTFRDAAVRFRLAFAPTAGGVGNLGFGAMGFGQYAWAALSGATTAYRNATLRFRLLAGAFKDATTRFRLQVAAFKDAGVRLRLRVQNYRDAVARFRLLAGAFRDAAVRFRLGLQGYKDAGLRLALRATTYRDATARFRLGVQAFKDATVRLRLRATAYRDAVARFALRAGAFRDATARFRLQVQSFKDATARFALRAGAFRDATARFRLFVQRFSDATLRLRLSATAFKDATLRFNLTTPGIFRDATARFRLLAGAYRDATARFRLQVQAFKDAGLRLRLRATAYRDVTARFRLLAGAFKDATLRFRLGLQGFKDATARLRLQAGAFRDATARYRLQVAAFRDAGLRLRLQVQRYADSSLRLRLSAQSFKDATLRFVLLVPGLSFRDATTRLRLRAGAFRDAVARFRLQVAGVKDATVRLRLRGQGYRDAIARLRLRAGAFRDSTLRFVVFVGGIKDAGLRLRLRATTYRDSTARVRLRANATTDAQTRYRLAVQRFVDGSVRLNLRAVGYQDATVRFNLIDLSAAPIPLITQARPGTLTTSGRSSTLLSRPRA